MHAVAVFPLPGRHNPIRTALHVRLCCKPLPRSRRASLTPRRHPLPPRTSCAHPCPALSTQHVVGAGDSATEEAHYITKYARHVHLLVRGPEMRASKTMRDRVLAHSGITVHYNTAVADAYGDGYGLQGLRLVDTVDGAKRDLPLRGLFYGIGHNPNSGLVEGQVRARGLRLCANAMHGLHVLRV